MVHLPLMGRTVDRSLASWRGVCLACEAWQRWKKGGNGLIRIGLLILLSGAEAVASERYHLAVEVVVLAS